MRRRKNSAAADLAGEHGGGVGVMEPVQAPEIEVGKPLPVGEGENAARAAVVDSALAACIGDAVEEMIPIGSLRCDDPMREVVEDEEDSIASIADGLRQVGQLNALIVRPPTGGGYLYRIVAGDRRYRAALLAGLTHLRCRVVKDLSDAGAEAIRIIENLHRKEPTPREEAKAVAHLLELHGGDVQKVADILGKGRTWVKAQERLNGLSGEVAKLFKSGSLPMKHAELISRLADPRERDELAEEVVADWQGGLMPLEDLRQEVNAKLLSLARVPWRKDVPLTLLKAVDGFGARPPACNDCPCNSANAEDLFKDIVSQDVGASGEGPSPMCSHAACYAAKGEAVDKLLRAAAPKVAKELEAKAGEKAVPLSTEVVACTKAMDGKAGDVLDPGAVAALVKAGRKAAGPDAKTKAAQKHKAEDPAEVAKRRAEEAFREATRSWENGIDAAVCAAFRKDKGFDRVALWNLIGYTNTFNLCVERAFQQPTAEKRAAAVKKMTRWIGLLAKKNPTAKDVLEIAIDHSESGGTKPFVFQLDDAVPTVRDALGKALGITIAPKPTLEDFVKKLAPAAAAKDAEKAAAAKKNKAAVARAAGKKTGKSTTVRKRTGEKAKGKKKSGGGR